MKRSYSILGTRIARPMRMNRNWRLLIKRRTVRKETPKPDATSLTDSRRGRDSPLAVCAAGLESGSGAMRRSPVACFP
jgi:hypothetical protein